ncbi:ABC transporter related protein [Thermodesulfatator indicus DSM 15286]|uniref:ABC transporter related protein n=1 Tax=Thermodesulfatator indicus (strain DSM 15286 / JCM 11887 / CIR29812) TaxID=667014 RepID=F8AB02_THEID|nr:ABC transporter ATP-binding protein [Thermodesulfatator indicus]AEH44368.1 ABC transporter related protein [Thermodesulfatator indicus DSM 15286]
MSVILENITKSFNKQKVLDNLNLEVKKGEFHVILGPSGEGKSTLLSIISGLIKPDAGKILIDGDIVNDLPPQKRGIGFVFQDFALFPHLTVFENVAYGLKIRSLSNKEIEDKVTFYLEMVGLEKHKDKFPSELSGGQKQRVALARALVIEPKVLLLDEPLSHVDAWQREKLREDLKTIQQKTGITTIYVTHDRLEAILLADKVSVLHQGRIEQTEPPKEIFYQPKTSFVARFVGATNIFKGCIIEIAGERAKFKLDDSNLIFTVKNYPIFKEKKEISLCLHPEKVSLSTVPKEENHFLGEIIDVKFLGMYFRVLIGMENVELEALVPKEQVSLLVPGENVWICFSPEALHPLCGRPCRQPCDLRKCKTENRCH